MKIVESLFKECRVKKGMSQKDISDILDVSINYISKIENNEGNYSLSNIQKLMNTFDIDLLEIKNNLASIENKYYLEEVILKDTKNTNYIIANNLNDLILKVRERLNLTQEQFSDKAMISINTISSYERNIRQLTLINAIDIFKLLDINNFYISKDNVIVFICNKEIIEKENLYKLAKLSCRAVSANNKLYSYLLNDLDRVDTGNELFNICFASNELELAYKMISLNPNGFLIDFIQEDLLNEDSSIDNMYKLLKEEPSLLKNVWLDYSYSEYEFSGEGLYLNFGDGGRDTLKISSLIEKIENNEIEFWDDMLDESEIDMTLVNKVYKSLIKSIY